MSKSSEHPVNRAAFSAIRDDGVVPTSAVEAARQRRRLILFVLAPAATVFVLMGLLAMSGAMPDIERDGMRALHRYAAPAMDRVMLFFTLIGKSRIVGVTDLLVFLLALWLTGRNYAQFFIATVGSAALLNVVAKRTITRPRPDLWPSMAPEASWSFPSAHAMGTMALYLGLLGMVWHTSWRWPVLVGGGLLVLLISFSRVYLGVHYPSDILGGWLGAICCATLAAIFLHPRRRDLDRRARQRGH